MSSAPSGLGRLYIRLRELPGGRSAVVNRSGLPPRFPTHGHKSAFWEELGRTVATFGFLEEVPGKAIFAFTATRRYGPDEIDAAYNNWLPTLQRALTDQLWNLAESYGKAAKDNPEITTDSVAALVLDIRKATEWRNVLCHGSWTKPDANGASIPFFVSKANGVFTATVDVVTLRQIQAHVAELACCVIDTVTQMGWQFSGGAGPGKPIW